MKILFFLAVFSSISFSLEGASTSPLLEKSTVEAQLAPPPEETENTIPIALSEVVSQTIWSQWDIQLSWETVKANAGTFQESMGPFDPTLDASYDYTNLHHVQTDGAKSHKNGYIANLDVLANKKTRIGTEFTAGLHIQQEFNPILLFNNPFNRFDNFNCFFTIDQPLLRRFLINQESADEKSALINLQASKYDLIQVVASRIRDSVQAYWDVVAAKKLLQIRKESQQKLVEISLSSQKLVEGGETAASELNQQFAELSRGSRSEISLEQDVFAAFNRLLLAMGMDQCPLIDVLPKLVMEGFPDIISLSDTTVNALADVAMQNRMDLVAANLRVLDKEVQVQAADNALMPELNLRLRGTILNSEVNKRAIGFFSAVTAPLPETDLLARLDLSIPLYNDRAKGEFRRRKAVRNQAYIAGEQLYETILNELSTAYRNHFAILDELKYADKAVKWYEAALASEVKRLKEGYSTLFVVLDIQNRLYDAMNVLVETHRDYAQNIVDLLFLTGTLVKNQDKRVSISDPRSFNDLLKELQPCTQRVNDDK